MRNEASTRIRELVLSISDHIAVPTHDRVVFLETLGKRA